MTVQIFVDDKIIDTSQKKCMMFLANKQIIWEIKNIGETEYTPINQMINVCLIMVLFLH